MGFFKRVDINEQVRIYKSTSGAILVDVREPNEFKKGSIPDAVNIPLSKPDRLLDLPEDAAIFIYCRSGHRSRRAVKIMKKHGYENVRSIGGITGYNG